MLVGVARVDSNLSRQVCFLKTPLKFLGYRSYRIQWNLRPTLCQGIVINYGKERSHYMPALMHLSSAFGEDSVFLCGSSLLIAALFQKFVFCLPYLYPSIYILDCRSVLKNWGSLLQQTPEVWKEEAKIRSNVLRIQHLFSCCLWPKQCRVLTLKCERKVIYQLRTNRMAIAVHWTK